MQKTKAFLLLVRFPNLFIIALTQFLIGFTILNVPLNYNFYIIICSTVLVAASGNIINDYFDVRFDHINKPNEIWVGTFFSRRKILILHWIISTSGVVLGTFSSIYVGLFNAFCVALLWFYSQKLKCVPFIGNLLVAILTSFVVLVLALKYNNFEPTIVVLLYFSFLINWIREITKDIEDIRGDRAFECNTIATKYGIASTKKMLLSLQFLLFSSFLTLLFFVELKFKLYLVIILLPLAFVLFYYTWKAHKKNHFKNLSRLEKLLILLGVLSLLLLKL